jgi:hypothetical protein
MSRRVTKVEDFRELKDMFMDFEREFNAIETELVKAGPDQNLNAVSIGWHFGKAYEVYKKIAQRLEVFEPKRRPTAPENMKPVVPKPTKR